MAAKKTKLSFDDMRRAVREAIQGPLPQGATAYVYDMYLDSAIYCVDTNDGNCKYFDVTYSIGDDGSATLGEPVEVKRETSWVAVAFSTAEFSVSEEEIVFNDDGTVEIKNCKVFELGNYPDKGFGINEEEFDSLAASFSPAPVEIEHLRSVFTKKNPFNIGELSEVWREGTSVLGNFKFKSWVKAALAGEMPKVSLGWAKSPEKRIVEASLVVNPRITSAQLSTAFATFAGEKPSRKGGAMSWLSKLKQALSEAPDEELANFGEKPSGGLTAEQVTEIVNKAVADNTAALEAKFGQVRTDATDVQADAAVESFATWLTGTGKTVPAQLDSYRAMFKQALIDDSGGKVVFSNGQPVEGPRVAQLKELINTLPDLKLKSSVFGEVHVAEFAGAGPDGDGLIPLSVNAREVVGGGKKES